MELEPKTAEENEANYDDLELIDEDSEKIVIVDMKL